MSTKYNRIFHTLNHVSRRLRFRLHKTGAFLLREENKSIHVAIDIPRKRKILQWCFIAPFSLRCVNIIYIKNMSMESTIEDVIKGGNKKALLATFLFHCLLPSD